MDRNLVRQAEALGRGGQTIEEVLDGIGELIRQLVPIDDYMGVALDPGSRLPVRVVYRTRMSLELVPRFYALEMTEARHFTLADVAEPRRRRFSLLSQA